MIRNGLGFIRRNVLRESVSTPQPRVLLTYKGDRAALAAVRGLHLGGYDVFAVPSEHAVPPLRSRCATTIGVDVDAAERPEDFARAVAALARSRHVDVVLPGCDASLAALSRYRDQLEGTAVLGLPHDDVVQRSLSKVALAETSAAVGMATPETITCNSLDEVLAVSDTLGYPVIAKPAPADQSPSGASSRFPSRIVENAAEAAVVVGDFGTPLLIQQRIDGPVLSFGGVMGPGGLLAGVLARYLRTWPQSAGNAAFSEAVVLPPELADQVSALLAQLGWQGIFELEFLQDAQGVLFPIDLNPRIYGSMALATAAHVNLASIWCDFLLNRSPRRRPAAIGAAGSRYRWEDGDARNALQLLRSGRFRAGLNVLRPAGGTVHSHFSWRDPYPFLARTGLGLRSAPSKLALSERALSKRAPSKRAPTPDRPVVGR